MESERKQSGVSVAWFKLADLIARKEREKALTVYRLLSHSLEDKAYALQLEGDILWSLDDLSAAEKYQQAAFLYKKEQRWINAISVCEHLLSLRPTDPDLLALVLGLYVVTDWHDSLEKHLARVATYVDETRLDAYQFYNFLKILVEHMHGTDAGDKKTRLGKLVKSYKQKLPDILQAKLELDLSRHE